ncbi:Non-LTR retroelement reverse transcriptase-like protein [Hibiscus syriacus]|uniref:Non-LTR retroelement reverse transcriptase-like protein n=1 Tax=Hibiscus syriacus TaxID=106335 RepID=A0A6A3BEN7_HIBSY|nr:Non-LTR retroelement reverse transcriptase-like protein [Hibiscus syriacus]
MNNWLSDISSEMALFGKYEVGKLLGRGAFAKVYQAHNVKTGETVAIKAVSKRKVLRGKLMAHVKMEIAIMHRLNHPNIVKLIEVLATKTKVYFVMEFAKGGEFLEDKEGTFQRRSQPSLFPAVDFRRRFLPVKRHLPPRLEALEFKIPEMDVAGAPTTDIVLDTKPETRITIDEIMNDPWFKDGFKEIKVHPVLRFRNERRNTKQRKLDAFDLISFSSGFDLSVCSTTSIFPSNMAVHIGGETVEDNSYERIRDEVDKIVSVEVISMTESGIRLEHQCSNLVIAIDVHQLTEKLVVVVVNRRELNARRSDGLWSDKLKPRLSDLVYIVNSNNESEETTISVCIPSNNLLR